MKRRGGATALLALLVVVLCPVVAWLLLADNASAQSLLELRRVARSSAVPQDVPAPPAFALHSHWLSEAIPRVVELGKTTTFSLEFENSGAAPWVKGTAAEALLGIEGDDTSYASMGFADGWLAPDRVASQTDAIVEPGAIGHFTFRVRGAVTGTVRIPVRLLVEHVAWMDDDGAYVEVVVRD